MSPMCFHQWTDCKLISLLSNSLDRDSIRTMKREEFSGRKPKISIVIRDERWMCVQKCELNHLCPIYVTVTRSACDLSVINLHRAQVLLWTTTDKVSVHPFVYFYFFGPHLQLKSRLTVNHQGIKTCMTERIRGWKMDWDKRMKEWITERQIGVTNFEQTVWVSVTVIRVKVAK